MGMAPKPLCMGMAPKPLCMGMAPGPLCMGSGQILCMKFLVSMRILS